MERHVPVHAGYREQLTPRQREVLQLVAEGRTNYEIATALGITLDGAKWHVREILGRLGCESREEAAAWWRAYYRPAAKLSRAFAPLFIAKGLAFAGVAAAAAAVALVAVLASRGGDETPGASTPGATSTPAPQTSATVAPSPSASPSPSPSPGAVRTCDTSAVQLTLREEAASSPVTFVVSASSQTPCTLDAVIRAQLMPGAPVQPTVRPVSVKVTRAITSTPTDVAAMSWESSCGSSAPAAQSPYDLRLTWQDVRAGQVVFTPPVATHAVTSTVPACPEPSRLASTVPPGQAGPTPGPTPALPGGLERVIAPTGRIDVRVLPGRAPSGATSCWDLVPAMVTTVEYAAGERGTVASCDAGDGYRFTYGRDPQGVYVLHQVELLLIAYDTLPDGLAYGDCHEIRPYLVPSTEDVANAGYVLVCGVVPRPFAPAPFEVWARLPKDNAPASIPAGTKCWELSRYLGPPRGAETTPVKCVIE